MAATAKLRAKGDPKPDDSSALLRRVLPARSPEDSKPLFRGKIHLLLILLSPLWITMLVRASRSRATLFLAASTSIATFFNFCASAMLHNINWTPSQYSTLKRFDHAGIFGMIVGTAVPMSFISKKGLVTAAHGLTLLACLAIGVSNCFFGDLSQGARHRRAKVYVVVGFINLIFICEYWRLLTQLEIVLLVGLAAAYTTGALVYSRKRPNPFPGIFEFHEVFHLFCLVGGTCGLLMNISILHRIGT